jgi:hypothetical protein
MLLGSLGDAVLQAPQIGTDRLKGRVLELSIAHAYKILGTSEIRYGITAGMEWGRPSRALQIKRMGIVAQESAHLRLFRSFAGDDGFTGIVAGIGARWTGVRGALRNGYLEIGSGIALTDGLSIDVNTHFNFASFLGGGVYFSDDPNATRIGLRWIHISNAGVEPPNRGLNQFELVFGVRL